MAFDNRAAIIANEPLLEAWLDSNRKRMPTIYGKANTTYETQSNAALDGSSLWTPGWTNTVPADLFRAFQ